MLALSFVFSPVLNPSYQLFYSVLCKQPTMLSVFSYQFIKNTFFVTNILFLTVYLTLWCTIIIIIITVPAGYVAEATIHLPAPTAELAQNITSFINTTLNNHPELKKMLGPGRERIIKFKKRPQASDLEKFGIELLTLPEMHMVTGMIPDIVVEELQKLGIVESIMDSRPIHAWNVTTKSITTQQGALSWVSTYTLIIIIIIIY
jgi:hypothetical protein